MLVEEVGLELGLATYFILRHRVNNILIEILRPCTPSILPRFNNLPSIGNLGNSFIIGALVVPYHGIGRLNFGVRFGVHE